MGMNGAGELGAVLKRHGPAVYGTALRILADPQKAEEAAQDVFLELWRTKHSFENEEHLGRWLRRVAVHRAVDALRRERSQFGGRLFQSEVDLEILPAPAAGSGVPPGLAGKLGGMVASLPAPMRAALVLRYGEDEFAPEEIAGLLGQPVATVKSNLARGLALLRRKAGKALKEYVRVSKP